jgi:site-specific DNA-methyltransferase (adenine-specific)
MDKKVKDYNHKNLKIINADCMDIMKDYEDNYFDLAIVDPPYRDSKENDMNQFTRKNIKNGRLKDWNNKPNNLYFNELFRISKNQIIWGANNFNLDFKGFIVWDKNIAFDMKFSQCEIGSLSSGLATISKMVKIRAAGSEIRVHPTQKPVKLYNWILKYYADKNFKILDTHLGSGSSAIASYYYGCKEFVGIEIDSDYYNASIKRIKEQTAQIKLL